MERTASNHQRVGRTIRHQTEKPPNPRGNREDYRQVETLKNAYQRTYKMLLRSSGRNDHYINTKTKLRTEDDRPDVSHHLNVWEKIIRAVTARQLNVTGYVYYAMTMLWNRKHEIFPNMLLNTRLLEGYQENRDVLDKQEQLRWESEKTLFRRECWKMQGYGNMTERQQRQFVLLDRNIQLSPLFVYLHAWINGLMDLCHHLRDSAALQYGKSPALYDELIRQEPVDNDKFWEALTRVPRKEK